MIRLADWTGPVMVVTCGPGIGYAASLHSASERVAAMGDSDNDGG